MYWLASPLLFIYVFSYDPIPMPIAESGVLQSFSLFPKIPNLTPTPPRLSLMLKPFLLQLFWKNAPDRNAAQVALLRPSTDSPPLKIERRDELDLSTTSVLYVLS